MIQHSPFIQVFLLLGFFVVGSVDCWVIPAVSIKGHACKQWSPSPLNSSTFLHARRTRRCATLDDESISSATHSLKSTKKSKETRKASTATDAKPDRSPSKMTKVKKEPSYWLVNDDKIEVEYTNGKLSLFHFKVRGNPKPLVRHRTAKGHMYSPSAVYRDAFRDELIKIIALQDILESPLFQNDDSLSVSVVLRMKRPTNHFVASKRGPDRLKATAPRGIGQFRSDVDNMVKFLLDAMNTMVYPDDRQICCLRVIRILDDEDSFDGSTEIRIRSIQAINCDTLIENTLQDVES